MKNVEKWLAGVVLNAADENRARNKHPRNVCTHLLVVVLLHGLVAAAAAYYRARKTL